VTVRRPDSTSTTQRLGDSREGGSRGAILRTVILRLLPAGLLGAGAAVLVSCGSSGVGLIPSENAGPLVADFQAVERTASKGDGNCAPTKAALGTTERDFQALPASVNAGLRAKLREGISHLQTLALELCAEPLAQTTTTGESTSTTRSTPHPTTSSTQTSTEPTSTTQTTSTTGTGTAPSTTTSGAEGGTSPEVGGSESEGKAGEGGAGSGQGGQGSGEASEGANNGGAAGPSGGTGSGGSGQ
jgi:hypothetical protein